MRHSLALLAAAAAPAFLSGSFACQRAVSTAGVAAAASSRTHAPSPAAPGEHRSARADPVPLGPCTPASCDYREEVCCEYDLSRMTGCVRKDAVESFETRTCHARGSDRITVECGHSKDCPGGESCCINDSGTVHCAPECEASRVCQPGPSAACPPGARCEPTPASRSAGVCVEANPSVQCGNERCSGETPVCLFDNAGNTRECLAREDDWISRLEHVGSPFLLNCASPRDCAGVRCCTGGPMMTECRGMCTSGIDVCDTVADCPEFLGPPVGCEHDPYYPPFIKTCRYGTP